LRQPRAGFSNNLQYTGLYTSMLYSTIVIIVPTKKRFTILATLLSEDYIRATTPMCNRYSPLIIDLRLKGMNALTLLAWVQETYPDVPIALAVCGESGSVALPDIVRCVEAVFVPKDNKQLKKPAGES
jgi:hypothetical protein